MPVPVVEQQTAAAVAVAAVLPDKFVDPFRLPRCDGYRSLYLGSTEQRKKPKNMVKMEVSVV